VTGALADLGGATVLVTGASSGIGRATAVRAGTHGATVVLAARREDRLRDAAARVEDAGGVAHAVPTDVTDAGAVDALVETAVERTGGLDAAVVNAGVGEVRDAPLSAVDFGRVTRTNVDGAFHTVRAALPHLREREGSLAFVGSTYGVEPAASVPVYAASKWWLRGFARSVAARHGDEVGVSVVNPAGVRTAFGHDTRAVTNAERYAPGEVLEPEQVAASVLFCLRQTEPAVVAELDLRRREAG
jgi:NADP-dependent 3-hydroxy acid dehydrogenase YdfG